jgi:L-ascorbate metabolism protein UlaG (beta-lactamase superfamily)
VKITILGRYSTLYLTILYMACIGFANTAAAQGEKPDVPVGAPDPQLSQWDNDFLDRQAALFLDTVQAVLAKYPPVLKEGKERGYAKLLLDGVFHEKYAAFRKPAQEFFHSQAARIISELEQTKVKTGARIWKVYDMGFIVRTKTVTIAFDLVSGATSRSKDFALNTTELDRLVNQCDVLFISHKHADHAEKAVAERFIRSGKPVVSPEQVWKNDSISSKILHPERNAEKVHQIGLSGRRQLSAVIFPGHQMASTDNNCVVVTTPDGITLAHIGDQINEEDFMEDFIWIDQVAKKHRIDILMTNAWTMDIFRIVKGFDPRLVLPGHELELGHPVWDRLPYWGDDAWLKLNYAQLKKSKYPVVALIWGESFAYGK